MRPSPHTRTGSPGRTAAEGIGGLPANRECHARLVNSSRPGFTLVELLVVMGILLLVAAVTLTAVNMNISGDRIRGASRQVQSYLEGARGRASYGANARGVNGAGYQCGVRFIPDSNNNSLATSMIYVERIDDFQTGTVNIERDSSTGDIIFIRHNDAAASGWFLLARQGLLANNCRIWTAASSNLLTSAQPYQILIAPMLGTDGQPGQAGTDDDANGITDDISEIGWTSSDDVPLLRLGFRYPDSLSYPALPATVVLTNQPYSLELTPQPMANQEPRQLAPGVVLDLSKSKGLSYLLSTPQRMDIMFSPRGTVVGPLAATGVVEFVLSDLQDALLGAPLSSYFWQASSSYSIGDAIAPTSGRGAFIYQVVSISASPPNSGMSEPTWPTVEGQTVTDGNLTWKCLASSDGCSSAKRERLIVRLSPQTGSTAVHPVYVSKATENGDPFRFAEIGEVAAQ
jgi:prepilin-type N-terminal cleavage/methylation domain-containing protein